MNTFCFHLHILPFLYSECCQHLFVVAKETIETFLKSIFCTSHPKLPGLTCKQCGKSFKSAERLKNHELKRHRGVADDDCSPNRDQVLQHTQLLLKLLLLKKNLDDAISYGDGERLLLCVKHMYLYFKCNNNYKYSLACFELLAQIKYFVSEKMAVCLTQDRFINMRGAVDSNYPADLLVEHSNKTFKDNFYMYRGEPTQQVLDRVSKSQSITSKILDNFKKEFATAQFIGQHKVNQEKYDSDVSILCSAIEPQQLYSSKQRCLRTPKLVKADPVSTIDPYLLLDWMVRKINHIRTQPYIT